LTIFFSLLTSSFHSVDTILRQLTTASWSLWRTHPQQVYADIACLTLEVYNPQNYSWVFYFFLLVSCVGVRLSSLVTSATNWPILRALDDRSRVWSSRWNENWQGKPKYWEKTCPSATLSPTNPTWFDPRRGGNPATNRLSYGAVFRDSSIPPG
jgi:hypothetical protein